MAIGASGQVEENAYFTLPPACRARLWHTARMLNRLFAAAPDLVTAAVFLVAWMAPAIPGPEYVDRKSVV